MLCCGPYEPFHQLLNQPLNPLLNEAHLSYPNQHLVLISPMLNEMVFSFLYSLLFFHFIFTSRSRLLNLYKSIINHIKKKLNILPFNALNIFNFNFIPIGNINFCIYIYLQLLLYIFHLLIF